MNYDEYNYDAIACEKAYSFTSADFFMYFWCPTWGLFTG